MEPLQINQNSSWPNTSEPVPFVPVSGTDKPQIKPNSTFFTGKGILRNYTITFGTEAFTLISMLLVLRIAARYWGAQGFGEYVLARRMIGLLQFSLLWGMGLALTRYVAIAREGLSKRSEATYFLSGLLIVLITIGIAVPALNIFAKPTAYLLFGSKEYFALVHAISLAVSGALLQGVAYGFLRGRMNFGLANSLTATNQGLVPLVLFAIPSLSVVQVVGGIGIVWCITSGAVTLYLLREGAPDSWRWSELRAGAFELMRYGAPRVVGESAFNGLLALPMILAAHFFDIEVAGFIGLGISLMNAVGSLFAPIGHIILPTASSMAARNEYQQLRKDAFRLVAGSAVASAALIVALELFLPTLLKSYLGPSFASAVPYVRIIIPAAVPFSVFLILRCVIDALRVRPINAKNLTLCLITFLFLAGFSGSPGSIPVIFLGCMVFLGVLTVYDMARLLKRVNS